MTNTQEINQCDGPCRPTAKRMILIFQRIPEHHEIRAVSIKGQGGLVIVESTHEGLDIVTEFESIYKGDEMS